MFSDYKNISHKIIPKICQCDLLIFHLRIQSISLQQITFDFGRPYPKT